MDWPTDAPLLQDGSGEGAGLPSCCPQVTAPPRTHASSRELAAGVCSVDTVLCLRVDAASSHRASDSEQSCFSVNAILNTKMHLILWD